MPAPNALTAPLASPSKKFHGSSALQTYPSCRLEEHADAERQQRDQLEHEEDAEDLRRQLDVEEREHDHRRERAELNTQTGMSTPNQSSIVVLAKYAVTPVTPAEKMR